MAGAAPRWGGLASSARMSSGIGFSGAAPVGSVATAWHSRGNLGRVWTPGFLDPSPESPGSWGNRPQTPPLWKDRGSDGDIGLLALEVFLGTELYKFCNNSSSRLPPVQCKDFHV